MPTPDDRPLTPSQLNTLACDLLEGSFPDIWVEGEIAELKTPASGHMYFVLKDAAAQVRCALFRSRRQWLRFAPREGQLVQARGKVTLYAQRGDYQLVCETLRDAGEGALRQRLEELKARLRAEGLFEPERKRPLPAMPRRIGVLTSATGAVIRDITSVLARRFPLVALELLPVPVQGDGAAARIRAMLHQAAASGRYDVLLIARGGGAQEDLSAFNDEALVRAIAASPVPVVTAIGHETDTTLADHAADLRAPTPSAAAERLVPDRAELALRIAGHGRRLQRLYQHALQQCAQRCDLAGLRLQAQHPQARLALQRQRAAQARLRLGHMLERRLQPAHAGLRHLRSRLQAQHPLHRLQRQRARLQTAAERLLRAQRQAQDRAQARLQQAARRLPSPLQRLQAARGRAQLAAQRLQRAQAQQLRALAQRLAQAPARLRAQHPARLLAHARTRLERLHGRPQAAIARRLREDALRLRTLGQTLRALGPRPLLERGYALLQHPDGRLLHGIGEAAPGTRLVAQLADGRLELRVEARHPAP